MKDYFVTTKNVMKFHAVMARIHHKLKGVERMALFFWRSGSWKVGNSASVRCQQWLPLYKNEETHECALVFDGTRR